MPCRTARLKDRAVFVLLGMRLVKRRAIPFPVQADTLEGEVLSSSKRRAKMWDEMNEGRPKAR
jgi:hypothetical protein